MSGEIHKRAMTLLLEHDPFRYLMHGCVFLFFTLIVSAAAYAPVEPLQSARAGLLASLSAEDLSGARRVAAPFLRFMLHAMPVVSALASLLTFGMAYATARKLAKQSPVERQERRELYAFLDTMVEQEEGRRSKRRVLLPFTAIMLVGCMALSVIAHLLPVSPETARAISRPASYFSFVAMLALPFAMMSEGTYYEDKLREYLRAKLILSFGRVASGRCED